jgi:hypothetical protein
VNSLPMQRLAGGKSLIILTAAASAIYLTMLLVTLPALSAMAGGLAVFDMKPGGYGLAYTEGLLAQLGYEGRNYYLTRQLPLDLFYPGLLALWMVALWTFMARKIGLNVIWAGKVWILPAFMALFDYVENAAVGYLLLSYPRVDAFVVQLASSFTISKSILATICFSALLGLAMWLGVRLFLNKNYRST